jgi:hypothetical protein
MVYRRLLEPQTCIRVTRSPERARLKVGIGFGVKMQIAST